MNVSFSAANDCCKPAHRRLRAQSPPADIVDGQIVVARANQGEWIEYTVRSPFTTPRNFNLQAMYSTAKTGVILNYYIDGQKVGSAALTPTGSNYALSNTTISMAPGTHILRVEIAAGGTDVGAFDWFRFVAT